MSWHKPAKRQRAGELGLITPLRQPVGLSTADPDQPARPDAGALLFDMLANRAQARSDKDAEIQAMRRAQEQQAAALDDAKFQIAKLEADAEQARVRAATRAEEQAQRMAILESRLEREAAEAARAGAELAAARRRLEEERNGGSASPGAAAATPSPGSTANAECASLRAALAGARLEAAAAREAGEAAARRAERNAEELAGRLEAAESESARLRAALDAARSEAETTETRFRSELEAAEVRAAEALASTFTNGGSVKTDASSEGDAVLLRTLRERLDAAEAEAAAVPALRAAAADAAGARERALAAESRAAQLRELLAAADEAAASSAAAAEQLRTWRVALADVGGAKGPAEAIALLRAAQDAAAEERLARGEADARAAAAEAELRVARTEVASTAKLLTDAKAEVERVSVTLARTTRRAELLARERESLRAVLASYDEEYLAQRPDSLVGPQAARLAEAEATLEGLHAHVLDLEAELERRDSANAADAMATQAAVTNPNATWSAVLDDKEEVSALRARCEAAEQDVAGLRAELDAAMATGERLAMRVSRGEYDPATTRVLHLRANPEAELARAARDADVERLESENAALARAVARLEAAAVGGATAVGASGEGTAASVPVGSQNDDDAMAPPSPAASTGVAVSVDATAITTDAVTDNVGSASLRAARLESEVSLLRSRVASLEKASDRLQAVFRRQITTFREAVYLLFGYRVEMASDPARRDVRARFHLTPQHAPPGADGAVAGGGGLVFDLMRTGALVLVPTSLTERQLAREAATYIGRFGSVPAFTANLTLESFQRQAAQGG